MWSDRGVGDERVNSVKGWAALLRRTSKREREHPGKLSPMSFQYDFARIRVKDVETWITDQFSGLNVPKRYDESKYSKSNIFMVTRDNRWYKTRGPSLSEKDRTGTFYTTWIRSNFSLEVKKQVKIIKLIY